MVKHLLLVLMLTILDLVEQKERGDRILQQGAIQIGTKIVCYASKIPNRCEDDFRIFSQIFVQTEIVLQILMLL